MSHKGPPLMFIRITRLLLLALCMPVMSRAGTTGMSGEWDFSGTANIYEPGGNVVDAMPVIGTFNFDTGVVDLEEDTNFFFDVWNSNGTLSDQLDGTYATQQEACWDANDSCHNWETLWEITQTGSSASVITIDTDADGIPGTAMLQAPFIGFTYQVDGTLISAVPIPATAWLFGSGLLGLVGVARRRKAA